MDLNRETVDVGESKKIQVYKSLIKSHSEFRFHEAIRHAKT